MITKEKLEEIRRIVLKELHELVDANTRPRSKAAATFTKRQAADLKAGMSDGVNSTIAMVLMEMSK